MNCFQKRKVKGKNKGRRRKARKRRGKEEGKDALTPTEPRAKPACDL